MNIQNKPRKLSLNQETLRTLNMEKQLDITIISFSMCIQLGCITRKGC